MAPSHVLVPLDGSPLSEEALDHALSVHDCRVTVLNVVSPVDVSMSESGVLEPGEDRRVVARERAQSVVEDARERSAGGSRVDVVVETGDPADAIVEYARETDVDEVVMGGHGREGSAVARLLGTVATAVVGETPVTVTVVR